MTVSDYPDFVTPGSMDMELAVTDPGGLVINGLASHELYNAPISGYSYQLAFDALTAAAPPTTPFCQLKLLWRNSGVLVDFQHWVVLTTNVAPANGNSLAVITGPTRAQHLAVELQNYDAAAVTVDATLFSSARQLTRHAGMQLSNNIAGSYTMLGIPVPTPNSEPTGLVPGNSPSIPVNPGVTVGRINALYAGPAMLTLSLSGAGLAAGMTVTMYQIDPNYAGSAAFQEIWSATYTANPALILPITLPRQPVLLTFQNLATSGVINVTWAITAQDIAS